MIAVKERLERLQGKETAMNIALNGTDETEGFIKKYGLEHGANKEFRSPFNIEKDAALAPLLESFEKYRVQVNLAEGRAGKEEHLKEGDFQRLFFDNGEPFSAAGGRYIARPWPPVMEVKSPILPCRRGRSLSLTRRKGRSCFGKRTTRIRARPKSSPKFATRWFEPGR